MKPKQKKKINLVIENISRSRKCFSVGVIEKKMRHKKKIVFVFIDKSQFNTKNKFAKTVT